MNKKCSDLFRLMVLVACSWGGFLHAADRNWNTGANAQWTNAATWVEGAVPTADDNVSLNNSNTITVATGVTAFANTVACREFSIPVDGSGPQYLTTGFDMTLSSWINVNYGNIAYGHTYRQTNGTITIPNGGYGIVLMDATAKPAANSFGRYILDGGTLKSDRIGVADDNGNNGADRYAGTGIFEFNNGTVQTRTAIDAVWFGNSDELKLLP